MSVKSEIDRIAGNVADAYTAVEEQGGELPETQNSANLPEAIRSIPSGGLTEEQVQALIDKALPAGIVARWSGTEEDIPEGWALYDGSGL